MTRAIAAAAAVLSAATGAGCEQKAPRAPAATTTSTVAARAETEPVATVDQDAADDPAIWRNPDDPLLSLIVGTDKKAGLHVYGLDGKSRAFVAAGRVNNVDLVDRGSAGVLVAASDRNDLAKARLQLYSLDRATGKLAALGSVSGGAGEAYGVCLWDSPGGLYAFSVLKTGAIHQVELSFAGGRPTGTIVRSMKIATQGEGCVVDPRTATLYVGEEDAGIWRFGAAPTASPQAARVARADGKHLVADVEGLALAPLGSDGGYLVASSQGDNGFALYSLPAMTPAGRFRVAAARFGSVEETDGIALALGSFGPGYPVGLLVVHDGVNAPHAQNFKFVSWADVVSAAGLTGQR